MGKLEDRLVNILLEGVDRKNRDQKDRLKYFKKLRNILDLGKDIIHQLDPNPKVDKDIKYRYYKKRVPPYWHIEVAKTVKKLSDLDPINQSYILENCKVDLIKDLMLEYAKDRIMKYEILDELIRHWDNPDIRNKLLEDDKDLDSPLMKGIKGASLVDKKFRDRSRGNL